MESHAEIPINKLFYFKKDAEIIAEKENKNQNKTNKQKNPKRHSGNMSELPPGSLENLNTWSPIEGSLEKTGRSGHAVVCHWEKEGFEVSLY